MDELRDYAESLDYQRLQAVVLGSMLAAPAAVGPVMAASVPEDFEGAYRAVYGAIRELHFGGDPVDETTLLHRLGEEDADFMADFLRTLRGWASDKPLPYCRMLHEKVIHERMKAEALGVQHSRTFEEAAAAAERLSALLSERRRLRTVTAPDAVMAFLQRLEAKKPKDFIRWGLDGLDEALYSEPGDFVVIGGYPSAGKTALAAQMALTMAQRSRVGFFSLETSETKLTDRLMAHLAQVPLSDIKTQRLGERQLKALTAAADRLYSLPIEIVEAASATVADIRAQALARRYQVIVVDYLQLVQARGQTRYEKVTEISQGLHTMAQTHGILVVALAQLSRPEKSKADDKPVPPGMSSFRESGQIEQDADAALLLYPENPKDRTSRRILKVGKNKDGARPPDLILDFDGPTQSFTEAIADRPRRSRQAGTRAGEKMRNEELELP